MICTIFHRLLHVKADWQLPVPSCTNKILETFTYRKYDLYIYNNGKILRSNISLTS